MASINSTGTINMAANNAVAIRLASVEAADGSFDMPLTYSYDLNTTSTTANGTLSIYLQNDNPLTSTFTEDPIIPALTITSGTFPGGKHKFSIDSNGAVNMKYIYFVYAASSGTGTLTIDGQISYKG